jgi:hypothetical protein
LSFANLSTKRQRIAALARAKRGVALSTLHHVIDLEWMKEAWRLTRKDGAPGIDGMTAVDYAKNLEANLLDLLGRIKSGRYQAPPVRRAYIPKGGWIASTSRSSDAPRIIHLIQFALGMMDEDARNLPPIFADVDQQCYQSQWRMAHLVCAAPLRQRRVRSSSGRPTG